MDPEPKSDGGASMPPNTENWTAMARRIGRRTMASTIVVVEHDRLRLSLLSEVVGAEALPMMLYLTLTSRTTTVTANFDEEVLLEESLVSLVCFFYTVISDALMHCRLCCAGDCL
jgi:hypothetical protein